MKKKIVEIAHDCLAEVIERDDICVDFTCGQGNDTLILSQLVNDGTVYAFDIQADALKQTSLLLEQYERVNVELIHDSHANVDQYVNSFKAGIFNCGYLPHGDETITTNGAEVCSAILKALELMEKAGRLVVVLYPGFEQGLKESIEVEAMCQNLPSKKYEVLKMQLMNRHHAPYILMIDKR